MAYTSSNGNRKGALLVLFLLAGWQGWAQGYALPSVPDTLREPEARAAYAATHYWERYNFADTTLLRQDYAEQALVDFVALLSHTAPETQAEAVGRWLDGASEHKTAYRYFADKANHYLLNPDSPLRNEALYLLTARHAASCKAADEATQSRAAYMLQLLGKNSVGSRAADFSYTTADGKEGRLSTTATDRMTLLLLYDPDCHRCQDLLFRLRHSSIVSKLTAEGKLAVLAVYTEEDEEAWQRLKDELPAQWLLATDKGEIKAQQHYDLNVMPVMFLLDKEKQVLLKNTTYQELTTYLTFPDA